MLPMATWPLQFSVKGRRGGERDDPPAYADGDDGKHRHCDTECRYTLLKMRILAFFTYKPYNTLNKITMITRINGQAQSS